MLGKDGRLYDSNFDFDNDGKLNAYEYSVMDDVVFGNEADESDEEELGDDLYAAGLVLIMRMVWMMPWMNLMRSGKA